MLSVLGNMYNYNNHLDRTGDIAVILSWLPADTVTVRMKIVKMD